MNPNSEAPWQVVIGLEIAAVIFISGAIGLTYCLCY